jgi:hypothetical protein
VHARPRAPVRMHALAEHVTRLLDALGHERVDALGHLFLLDEPEEVTGEIQACPRTAISPSTNDRSSG